MLSITRSFVCSFFLLITFSFIPSAFASCGKSVPLQSTFHNAPQDSQSTLSESEIKLVQDAIQNIEYLKDLDLQALKPHKKHKEDILDFLKENYSTIQKILDAFSALMATKKIIYLATHIHPCTVS